MFEDALSADGIDEDVRRLARQYGMLSESDRELIGRLIDALAEKRA